MLIQEPWIVNNRVCGLNTNGYRFSDNDNVAMAIEYDSKALWIVSAYMAHDHGATPPQDSLKLLVSEANNRRIPVIIGADANAHHEMWGSTDTNAREKRPLKSLVASPIFRSPSARLLQREYCTADAERCGTLGSGSVIGITNSSTLSSTDGVSSLGSIVSSTGGASSGIGIGMGNEVLHYTFRPSKQISYATLNKKGITTCSPPLGISPYNTTTSSLSSYHPTPQPMEVSLLSPNNPSVTSSLSEYRFRPEVVTTSNRIQESCI
ncbi:uncharacterized protein LOC119676631 [Teleopsis dalmanni]|uniref:uncharacterized protein LOC119676631 n=1 Tax=Teleopsis dalmanni TaxID=139649 RepID=UPI0018CE5B51|nr:uncharacterized protein LOC119676631 [Teleopsis dalmanni]